MNREIMADEDKIKEEIANLHQMMSEVIDIINSLSDKLIVMDDVYNHLINLLK